MAGKIADMGNSARTANMANMANMADMAAGGNTPAGGSSAEVRNSKDSRTCLCLFIHFTLFLLIFRHNSRLIANYSSCYIDYLLYY